MIGMLYMLPVVVAVWAVVAWALYSLDPADRRHDERMQG